jgi:hypothetical protein
MEPIRGEPMAGRTGAAAVPLVGQKLGTFVASENSEDLSVLRELLESGKVAPAVDLTYPLRDVPAAIRRMIEGHARGKFVITIRRNPQLSHATSRDDAHRPCAAQISPSNQNTTSVGPHIAAFASTIRRRHLRPRPIGPELPERVRECSATGRRAPLGFARSRRCGRSSAWRCRGERATPILRGGRRGYPRRRPTRRERR